MSAQYQHTKFIGCGSSTKTTPGEVYVKSDSKFLRASLARGVDSYNDAFGFNDMCPLTIFAGVTPSNINPRGYTTERPVLNVHWVCHKYIFKAIFDDMRTTIMNFIRRTEDVMSSVKFQDEIMEDTVDKDDGEDDTVTEYCYIDTFLKIFYSDMDISLADEKMELKDVSLRFYESRRLRDYIHVAKHFINHFRRSIRVTHDYYETDLPKFNATRITNRLHGYLNDLEDKFRVWSDNYRSQIDRLKTMDPQLWNCDMSHYTHNQ